MTAYLDGGHAYHATMPTDGLSQFYDTMLEMKAFGFDNANRPDRTRHKTSPDR